MNDKAIKETDYEMKVILKNENEEEKELDIKVKFAHTLRCHIWLYIAYEDVELSADITNNRKYDSSHEIAFLQGWITGYFNRKNWTLVNSTIK